MTDPWGPITCPGCGEKFSFWEEYQDHLKKGHKKKGQSILASKDEVK